MRAAEFRLAAWRPGGGHGVALAGLPLGRSANIPSQRPADDHARSNFASRGPSELSRTRRATRHGRTGGLAEFRPCEAFATLRVEAAWKHQAEADRSSATSLTTGTACNRWEWRYRNQAEAACSLMACKRSSVRARLAPLRKCRELSGGREARFKIHFEDPLPN